MEHQTQKVLNLEDLIDKLHHLFSGDEVNVDEVQRTMQSYDASAGDWQPYATYDKFRYTRNLVDAGNGKFNLILLCWGAGHRSGIHDHTGSHCWMKVVDGQLQEQMYGWPKSDGTLISDVAMKPIGVTDLHCEDVAYIHDQIGLHRVQNSSMTSASSLHLYSPPFDVCRAFDEATGKARCCQMVFWTKFGEKQQIKEV